MLYRGFVSIISSDVCPIDGRVYVDSFIRIKGIEALVLKYTLKAKVLFYIIAEHIIIVVV